MSERRGGGIRRHPIINFLLVVLAFNYLLLCGVAVTTGNFSLNGGRFVKYLLIGLALVIGALVPAQAAMNAKMRVFVINPLYSALINFCVGAAALLLMLSISTLYNQPGDLKGAAQAPLWAWLGGLIGSSLVISGVLMVPRTGAAGYSSAIITGQLIGALILDHYGMLGLSQRLMTPSRLAGLVFMLTGLWLVQRR